LSSKVIAALEEAYGNMQEEEDEEEEDKNEDEDEDEEQEIQKEEEDEDEIIAKPSWKHASKKKGTPSLTKLQQTTHFEPATITYNLAMFSATQMKLAKS
ncbi:hypothetical protein DXG01_001081, partial [Tephrocybe rancida]